MKPIFRMQLDIMNDLYGLVISHVSNRALLSNISMGLWLDTERIYLCNYIWVRICGIDVFV